MKFKTPVSIKEHPRINDWLRRVECEMRNTLAQMLAASVAEYTKITSGAQVDIAQYNQWLDKCVAHCFCFLLKNIIILTCRFPTQLVVLTAQVAWTQEAERILEKDGHKGLKSVQDSIDRSLKLLADSSVLQFCLIFTIITSI